MKRNTLPHALSLFFLLSVLAIGISTHPIFAQTPSDFYTYLPFIVRAGVSPQPTSTPTQPHLPTSTPTQPSPPPSTATDWHQHAADAQRTSYMPQSIPTPWRWKWAWNGPNASGGIVTGKFGLPRNSQPVVGGGRVYIAAGSRGVYALNNANGSVVWNRTDLGTVNSTPAYDPDTGALFVLSANGTLYRLNSATGATLGSFPTGASSNLPLPPAIAGQRVFFSMGNFVYALDKNTLQQFWCYDADSPVDTPPAYSASRDLVVVASRDLYVHGIRNTDGGRVWRVKHTPLQPGDPGESGDNDFAEVSRGWPVVADASGVVLIKLRLDWQSLWDWNPGILTDNIAMRQHLQNKPKQKALLAINLDNGNEAFVAHVPHAGFGDGGYMPMGPMPVIKTFPNGKQIAYVVMRGGPCKQNPCDSRWDSHLGEMMLDDQTVSGLLAGYVRYMDNTFFPSDEQAFLSMAGDHIFAAHWEAGIAHKIEDRSPSKGTGTNPITVSNLPHIATSQDIDVCGSGFRQSHYCASGLYNTRNWPPGFYIYWRQGAVYDQYWSEYAQWVISRDTLYFVSTDGAVVALEHGIPPTAANGQSAPRFLAAAVAEPTPVAPPSQVLSPQETWGYVGHVVTVQGKLVKVFNNRKTVLLAFHHPHQRHFVVLIAKSAWSNFPAPPEQLYTAGQEIRVRGKLGWYQGAPVMWVETPDQIEVVSDPHPSAP